MNLPLIEMRRGLLLTYNLLRGCNTASFYLICWAVGFDVDFTLVTFNSRLYWWIPYFYGSIPSLSHVHWKIPGFSTSFLCFYVPRSFLEIPKGGVTAYSAHPLGRRSVKPHFFMVESTCLQIISRYAVDQASMFFIDHEQNLFPIGLHRFWSHFQ